MAKEGDFQQPGPDDERRPDGARGLTKFIRMPFLTSCSDCTRVNASTAPLVEV